MSRVLLGTLFVGGVPFYSTNTYWDSGLGWRPSGLTPHHRDLALVQTDLATACPDSGKLSQKPEYPLKTALSFVSLATWEQKIAPSLFWDLKLSNEGSFVEIRTWP